MPEFDWEHIRQGKDAYRDRMAALPFEQKLKLLERLRDRTLAVAGTLPSLATQRSLASNLRVLVTHPPQQVGHNASGAANVGFFGATATLAAALAAITPWQSNALTMSVVKRP